MSADRVATLPRSPRGDAQTPAEHGSAEAAVVGEDVARAPAPNPPEPPRTERPLPQLPAKPDDGDRPRDRQPGRNAGRGLIRRHPLASATGLVLVILAVMGAFFYWDDSRHFESTDDAFIAARQFSVAPKVSGYIAAVPVTDNQHVDRGDVIARIDDRDYHVAVVQAQAQVAGAQASIENIDAQLKQQQAQIVADRAKVDQAQAALAFARQQATRYQDLAKTGAGTIQNAQQYSSQLKQNEASVATAQATLDVAQRQIDSLEAQRDSAVASRRQAQAQLDQAQLNLSYTVIAAAQPGRAANLSAAVGEYATAGTALATFVPDEIRVTANFKETQLDAMRPGQPVTLAIDAFPERTIHGHVASVQPGSGTAFSLLPVQNATGNFVKIVQRVPVKLVMDDPPVDVALGPGMSVVPTVRVDARPSLFERLRARL